MAVLQFIADWLWLPFAVTGVASGFALKFRRDPEARCAVDGWRVLRVGGAGRVLGASLAGFTIGLVGIGSLPAGANLAYMLALVGAFGAAALLMLRYAYFYSVRWNGTEIEHRGMWRRRTLRWDDVVRTGYSVALEAVWLRDRLGRRFWIPDTLDGHEEFNEFAAERLGSVVRHRP